MDETVTSRYVAIVPAAGAGTRLPDRELSKELMPYGTAETGEKPVIAHLLKCLRRAAIDEMIIVLREDKQDIVNYLAAPDWEACRFHFEKTPGTSGVPETVALGLRRLGNKNVAFGFPDILFEPQTAYVDLQQHLDESHADIVLGVFPTDNPAKFDMVATDDQGRVLGIEIKPESTDLQKTWILAVWTPAFSRFLVDLVFRQSERLEALADAPGGSHLGHAFQVAMKEGFIVEAVTFDDGRLLDIGTPEDLARARGWESHDHG